MTLYTRLQQHRRRQQGQTLVLGAVTMVLIALMMMLTLSVGNATHERIRLQAHTDAVAYSKAVEVARAFNYFAYSNRAIAGVMISMASIHSWMTLASLVPDIWTAGSWAWLFVALTELGKICMHTWCTGFQHIVHMVQAFRSMSQFRQEANNKRNQLRTLDQRFNNVMQALNLAITTLRASQLSVKAGIIYQMTVQSNWGGGNNGLKEKNGRNISENNNLFDGANLLMINQAFDDDETRKRTELAEMANGSRFTSLMWGGPNPIFKHWLSSRGIIEQNFAFLGVMAPMGQFRNQGSLTVQFSAVIPFGTGRTRWTMNGNGANVVRNSDNHNRKNQGLALSSYDSGGMLIMLTDCTEHFPSMGFWFYELSNGAFLRSDSQGNGQHTPNQVHQGQHQVNSCFRDGSCFTKFAAGRNLEYDGPGADGHGVNHQFHNQPFVYASSKLNLRNLEANTAGNASPGAADSKKPWELTNDGRVSIATPTGAGEVHISPSGEAAAISKAMVYYHRPGEWRETPNFWNPFWRAKLHPFNTTDAAMAGGIAAGGIGGAVPALVVP